MKNKLFLNLILVLALVAAGGGATWWYLGPDKSPAVRGKEAAAPANYRYISMDKVIVMLRNDAGGPMKHYLSTDLVLKFPVEQEKNLKEQIPLLRSIAVKALSDYSFEKAGTITIDQMAADINLAFNQSYEQNPKDKPFHEVLIGKLIIE